MKEIIIRTNFNKKIGLGHFFRCLYLQKLLTKKKFIVTFIIDNNIVTSLTKNLNIINFGNKKFNFLKDAKNTYKALKNKNISLIIIDDYRIDYKWENFFKKKGYKVAVLDDLANRKHSCDYLIDSGWYGLDQNYFRYKKLVGKKTIKLLGPKYKIINPKLKKIKTGKKNFLIYFGGGNYFLKYKKLIFYLIEELNKIKLKSININLVISDLFKLKKKFFYKNIKIKIINNSYNLSNVINNTYLYIGANSSIVNELSYLNIPRILISVNKNQNVDINPYQELGNYFYIKHRRKIDHKIFSDLIITIIKNYKRVKDLHKRKKINIDKNGPARIVKILIKKL